MTISNASSRVWWQAPPQGDCSHPALPGLCPVGATPTTRPVRTVSGGWPKGVWGAAPNVAWSGQDVPAEVVAGTINTSCGYNSGLTIAVYSLGGGRFTINTFRIRKNLGRDPVAERLLRNMLNYAAVDVNKPAVEVPADFDEKLKAMGL